GCLPISAAASQVRRLSFENLARPPDTDRTTSLPTQCAPSSQSSGEFKEEGKSTAFLARELIQSFARSVGRSTSSAFRLICYCSTEVHESCTAFRWPPIFAQCFLAVARRQSTSCLTRAWQWRESRIIGVNDGSHAESK